MDKLFLSLEPALVKLSELFCVSIDVLKANAMKYVLMYGRYEFVSGIVLWFFISFIAISIIIATTFFVLFMADELNVINWKKTIKISIYIVLISTAVYGVCESTIYLTSPEIYSIKEVMQLLQ